MRTRKHRDLSTDEQHILEHCHLRLLSSAPDSARCDQLIVEHHYLHSADLVGEQWRYALV